MTWDSASAAADAASFLLLGYSALWRAGGLGAGVACRVQVDREGQMQTVFDQALTSTGLALRLLKSEVPAPASKDTMEVTQGGGTVTYQLKGAPREGAGGRIWIAEAFEVQG